jgi:hypothetical protein
VIAHYTAPSGQSLTDLSVLSICTETILHPTYSFTQSSHFSVLNHGFCLQHTTCPNTKTCTQYCSEVGYVICIVYNLVLRWTPKTDFRLLMFVFLVVTPCGLVQSWRWSQYVPRKRFNLPTSPHVVTTQNNNIDIFTPWEPEISDFHFHTEQLIKCTYNTKNANCQQ